ncbi:ABC transporter ATP-binding protein [Methanococcus voltae]|uniref:Fe-S cluster assembly ATP-binding protein n=2 Tax=Methanococcus voltae TaxID=2188 RepID=A0A8J7US75_METVO|nr:ABC transporter ATP-binding protein [Methanococcus voltae]MBP2171720.1 Fe-S cluster assembly ATP-binding protein [Methanococcus voltae]MBP2201342.1 Fe-S cluster assembly ATP-binding protein [Methanococcus voltae]MCS3922716.1 Fe-S cluster assembly ATP-binding protein [Methanococcus voltae PS]
MLQIEDLSVKTGDKVILKDIHLYIDKGESHVLFGPNGAGKSTLLNTILGNPKYEVVRGNIYFKGHDITDMPMYERAKLGIGISYQSPPSLSGVKLNTLLESITTKEMNKINEMAEKLNIKHFYDRDVNVGFSGGEVKRSELLQIYAQNPELIMFDEPDSGVDVENVELLGGIINHLLDKDKKPSERKKSGLIITHLGYILNFMDVDKAHVLYDGVIACSGSPNEILPEIIKNGYERCVACSRNKKCVVGK